ncbi:uncharacterized protein LOC110850356 isoform X1 [Folsomia candida]|nr:uncharacterized protein LOC110850356 isoform X1 [Folsomia candida]
MTEYIHGQFSHLLRSLNSHEWLTPMKLQEFADTLVNSGCAYPNVVGFIDGTARPICRPSINQRQVYSGYYKTHTLKYQSIMLPNGIIGRLDGPFNGRRHDSAILGLSGLIEELERKFVQNDGSWYTLYGDPGYANQKFIKIGYKNNSRNPLTIQQKNFNRDMSALRVHVEYGFGKVIQLFVFLDYKKNQKLLLQCLRKQYDVAVILSNCHTCLRGSQVTKYFGCAPPELEEYLH